jgi:hypothetical protein
MNRKQIIEAKLDTLKWYIEKVEDCVSKDEAFNAASYANLLISGFGSIMVDLHILQTNKL